MAPEVLAAAGDAGMFRLVAPREVGGWELSVPELFAVMSELAYGDASVAWHAAPGPVLEDYLACTPLGRYGHVEDIAAMARFLIGPEAGWVTGTVINVDGGHHLRRGPDISPLFQPRLTAENLRGLTEDPGT